MAVFTIIDNGIKYKPVELTEDGELVSFFKTVERDEFGEQYTSSKDTSDWAGELALSNPHPTKLKKKSSSSTGILHIKKTFMAGSDSSIYAYIENGGKVIACLDYTQYGSRNLSGKYIGIGTDYPSSATQSRNRYISKSVVTFFNARWKNL